MIGLPGSGKSATADLYEEKGYKVHSSDAIRAELLGDVSEQNFNQLVFDTLEKRVIMDLANGQSVVYDATNVVMKRRVSTLKRIFGRKELRDIEIEKVAAITLCTFNECIDRDLAREKKVGYRVIEKFYKSWQTPMLQEGFDKITTHYTSDTEFSLVDTMMELSQIPQFNHWHTFTIGGHCENAGMHAGDLAKEKGFIQKDVELVFMAGLLHDIGKKFTLSFRDSKGRVTNEAHFYSHEAVSAYDSLFFFRTRYAQNPGVMLQVSQLISQHMIMHLLEKKTLQKKREFFGEDFWNKLDIVHVADKESR